MTRYVIKTTQTFDVTYSVDADTPEEAWDLVLREGQGECIEQIPAELNDDWPYIEKAENE